MTKQLIGNVANRKLVRHLLRHDGRGEAPTAIPGYAQVIANRTSVCPVDTRGRHRRPLLIRFQRRA